MKGEIMKMYIPFGDWSDDGHGKYDKVLVEAESMQDLYNAQKCLCARYGNNFFDGFADDYADPHLSPVIWQALKDTNYPVERMIQFNDIYDWTGIQSIDEALAEEDGSPMVNLDFVEDVFIWLLNAFDADIVRLDSGEDIPMICNWTCPGFETVGYGCFW